MKLKKIASLALAGIMAVSMLAGCNGGNGGNGDDVIVTPPTDTSFAASVNAELNDKQKAILTFESDATLDTALKAVADKFDSATLATTSSQFMAGTVMNDFLAMVDADLGIGGFVFDNTSEDDTRASILVVPGNYTEEGMVKEVAKQVGNYIKTGEMANQSDDKSCRYTYSGDISMVKVESLSGNYSAYVVGVVVTQHLTKVAN